MAPSRTLAMAIYTDGRVENEVRELAKTKGEDNLTFDDIDSITSMHYLGTQPLEAAAREFTSNTSAPQDKVHVLDLGAGYAGPSRYLAAKHKFLVTALELQEPIHSTAQKLTDMVGPKDSVTHECGHLCELKCAQSFDGVMSILCILHVPANERHGLLQECANRLRLNGKIFCEDFFHTEPLTDEEQQLLRDVVSCSHVPSQLEWETQLSTAGFTDIKIIDMTEAWRDFVMLRHDDFVSARERNLRVHGEELTRQLEHMYATVAKLFSGNLRGARIIATKKD
jgi:cyclopropane fatty-acyl-phospholipid synthase-like methyltransferase